MIEREKKAQPAFGFPEGWTFAFDLTSNEYKFRPQYKGLSIMAPTRGKTFCCVEDVISENRELFNINPKQFYSKVGLSISNDARKSNCSVNEPDEPADAASRTSFTSSAPLPVS